MRTKNWNLLMTIVVILLFSFSCFCVSRIALIRNQLINCRNHMVEFKETILRLKNKHEKNLHDIVKVLSQVKDGITWRENLLGRLVEKKVDTLSRNETTPNRFEEIKFFLPHLRKVRKIYPDVVIGKGRSGVSFALGIPTMSRRNHTYLKQTLTSVVSRMTPSEANDSVVIVSVADSNEEYLNYVVHMVKTKFKEQVQSGSLEVISVPSFLYQSTVHDKQPTKDSEQYNSWRIKQALDVCILMLYAQPKAMYYLQLEDDIIAKKTYFTRMSYFVNNIAPNDWYFIEFSVLGFIGKLFRSEDLSGFVRFFLMFYQEKPIDLLLDDIFTIKMCDHKEAFENCLQRKKEKRIRFRPSLFQHVGIHSSLPGKEQHLKGEMSPSIYPHPSLLMNGGHLEVWLTTQELWYEVYEELLRTHTPVWGTANIVSLVGLGFCIIAIVLILLYQNSFSSSVYIKQDI